MGNPEGEVLVMWWAEAGLPSPVAFGRSLPATPPPSLWTSVLIKHMGLVPSGSSVHV